jgi:hypothetical protein
MSMNFEPSPKWHLLPALLMKLEPQMVRQLPSV